MEIRNGRAGDWPAVAALLAELGRPDVRGADDESAHERAFVHYLNRKDTLALVAEEGNELVGFCDMEYKRRLNVLSPQAWIPDLVVAEHARGRGIGRALLEAAEERARAAGCFAMSLESANWRTDSHAFYERVGWEHSALSFIRKLSDVQWPAKPR
jgi:GNAT superfamily N-acetyltransferase